MIVVRNSQPVNAGKRRIGMQYARSGYEATADDQSGVAEGPVSSEPVSTSNFPVPRENTGNFAILRPVAAY